MMATPCSTPVAQILHDLECKASQFMVHTAYSEEDTRVIEANWNAVLLSSGTLAVTDRVYWRMQGDSGVVMERRENTTHTTISGDVTQRDTVDDITEWTHGSEMGEWSALLGAVVSEASIDYEKRRVTGQFNEYGRDRLRRGGCSVYHNSERSDTQR
ncbi:hypothetical protein Tco_0313033 [Tanacetum coccineum]